MLLKSTLVYFKKVLPFYYYCNNGFICYVAVLGDSDIEGITEGQKIVLWFVNEGTLGCFKDIVLSNVAFEPVLVDRIPCGASQDYEELEAGDNVIEAKEPSAFSAENVRGNIDGAVRHILVGCEGSAMTVLHGNLPFTPFIGCWIRYKRFGAYTNSLASNDISEVKFRKHYFWCQRP